VKPNLPKISVIVPSYNQAAYIGETLDSLWAQDYPLLEVIVVDGGSTDGSVDIIRAHELRLAHWVSEKDSGQSEAINKGFRKATGEVVTWLNSDDCYEPGTLQAVGLLFAGDPQLGLVHGKSLLFGEGRKQTVIGLDHDIPLHGYFPYMRFPQPSSFFRRSVLAPLLPVSETLHYAMDFELVVKLLLSGGVIRRMPGVLSRYRLHPQSKSNHQLAFLKEWSRVVAGFFQSVEGGEVYLDRMRNAGLQVPSDLPLYVSALNFTSVELEDVFWQHLHLCYHTCYQALDREACRRISYYIKVHDHQRYVENNYAAYDRRLKFIPKFVFNWLR